MSTVLVVEDESHIAEGLRFNLEQEGYSVEVVGDGETAVSLLTDASKSYDAVVLDVMLPGKDGFEIAAELRAAGQFVPILMLTARGRPEDVLRGFESGADDYLPKPFVLSILIARLHGLLRRKEWLSRHLSNGPNGVPAVEDRVKGSDSREGQFEFEGKVIDFSNLQLRIGERTVQLTLMEADLLRYLITHEGKAISRKDMLENVWGLHEDTDTRAIDNFIVRLRKYIEPEPAKPRHLLTVRGIGYRFIAQPSAEN